MRKQKIPSPGNNLHMDIRWNASPINTTWPFECKPMGGAQSSTSRRLISVSACTLFKTRDRKGSDQVFAKARSSSQRSSLVAGTSSGAPLPGYGHEQCSWQLKTSGSLSAWFPGTSRTGNQLQSNALANATISSISFFFAPWFFSRQMHSFEASCHFSSPESYSCHHGR